MKHGRMTFLPTSPKRQRGTSSLALRAGSLLAFLFPALGLVPALAEAPRAPVFVVQTAAGTAPQGTLMELKADGLVRLDGADGPAIAGGDVLGIRRLNHPRPPLPSDRHLILANGDRIPADGVRLDGERLRFRHPDLAGGKDTELPLAALAVLWLNAPDNADDPEKVRRRLATESRTRDVALLRNGDVLEGALLALDEKRVEIEVEKKPVKVDLPQVAAVALGTELADSLRPPGPYTRVVLTGDERRHGTRLSLASATCADGNTLEGTTLFGAKLRVPLAAVAALNVYQGRAVYLSDLKPAKYEHTPYFGVAWPFVADGSVAGRDLRLGGATHDKGLGLHSHSRLTYALGGAYQRFEAVVGLDDQTGREGSVRIKVLADGKPLDVGADKELTARTGPLAINVKVAGVKEMTLEVEFGENADVQDHVNWVDARLVK
jgi:hypothetical protein